jgi:hypothetical protein
VRLQAGALLNRWAQAQGLHMGGRRFNPSRLAVHKLAYGALTPDFRRARSPLPPETLLNHWSFLFIFASDLKSMIDFKLNGAK